MIAPKHHPSSAAVDKYHAFPAPAPDRFGAEMGKGPAARKGGKFVPGGPTAGHCPDIARPAP